MAVYERVYCTVAVYERVYCTVAVYERVYCTVAVYERVYCALDDCNFFVVDSRPVGEWVGSHDPQSNGCSLLSLKTPSVFFFK